jgi:hypothetical protein
MTNRATIAELRQDGDTLDLEDGRTLRLRLEPDQDASINDYESDGKVEWTRGNDYGPVRPDDFTGRARILNKDHGYSLWWEPYHELTEEQIRSEEYRIRMLVEYGFQVVVLELCEGTDAYGHLVVKEVACLGGVEWDADNNGYLDSVVSDLLAELDISIPLDSTV